MPLPSRERHRPALLLRPDCSKLTAVRVAIRIAMTITPSRAMLGAWLATGIAVAHAADTPARLREDEAAIESKLHVPDGIEPGRYDVRCDLRVMENGKPRNIWCYAPDSAVPGKLVAAVLNATLRAKFVPATRDGKPAQV